MQELIEGIKEYRLESRSSHVNIQQLILIIETEYIEKEKQMIIDAYFADDMRGGKYKMTKQERAEQYYNETFKND